MARRTRPLLAILGAGAALAVAAAGMQPGAAAPPKPAKPTKVVIIVVDALSKEIVNKYDMQNVKGLMADYVDTPKSYLGHTGSVTVVTHNVITSGLLPKHTGWTTEGYRDVDHVLGDRDLNNGISDGMYISSDWDNTSMFPVMEHYGYPKLADYLDATGDTFTISPKVYAAYAFGGPGSTSIVTFAGVTCPDGGPNAGLKYRGPVGINVPSYVTSTCGSRYYVARGPVYDTNKLPARLYSVADNRYVVGHDADHLGGDIWATDMALDVMDHEDDWSGIFVTLPGVDKAAHMWGGVNDPGPTGADGDPMTHLAFAAATADAQVGRIMAALEESGELDNTLVVLTADHGSVAVKSPPNGIDPVDPHFHGTVCADVDCGFFNWYYGDVENENDTTNYNKPSDALKPLADAGNLAFAYNDSSLNIWLHDQSPAKVAEAAGIMATMPDVTAVWRNDGDHFTLVSPVRYDLMATKAERQWFDKHAQELVSTQAAPYGPDLIATLPDNTTYSVAGDHGGIQRAAQQIPIVFAGAGLSSKDVTAPVRSVDIMPTILRAMGIAPTYPMDGVGYPLPLAK
jgi:hypothetical protein